MVEREGRLHEVSAFPLGRGVADGVGYGPVVCRAEEPIPSGWTCELGCGLGLVGIALAS